MFVTWRRSPWFVQEPLYNTPGDGSGGGGLAGADGDAHPEYDVDEGDPAVDDPPAQGDPPGVQPPARSVRQPAAGDPPPAGQDPRTQPFTQAQVDQLTGNYRQMERNYLTLQGQNQLLQRQIAALTGAQPPAQPDPDAPQLSEKDQTAIKAVYRLFPQLKPLLEKAKDLLALPEQVQGFHSDTENRFNDIATRMWTSFDQAVGKAFNLANETKLTPFAQQSVDSAFVTWLEKDRNAAARYRMGDMTLPAEFMRMYTTGVIGAAQRAPGTPNQRGLIGRPGVPPRVPRGGPGTTTVGSAPPQPNVKKPDEVHDAAADAFFAAR